MALFDGLFDPQQYAGLLGDMQRMFQQPQQAQAAFNTPQSLPSEPAFDMNYYRQGDVQVPIFGQPQAMEASSQQRMQQPMPQAPQAMPQQAPQAQPLGFSDRLAAAQDGAQTGAGTMGTVGALLGGIGGFISGDGGNVTVKALMARGLDRDTARAATKSPQMMAAILPQLFGTRSGVNINNRLVDPTTGRLIADYSDTEKPVVLGNDQRLVKPTTGQQVVGPAQVAKFDDISGVRKEISGLPEVKRYSEALPIFRSMVGSHGKDSAAADLDYVYGVAKIFDPDSVVREGEMKLVGTAQSLPEDIKGFIKRVAMGEGRLTPEARLRILEVANTRISELKGSYDQRTGAYTGIAQRHNIRPEDVMPQLQDMPTLPKPQAQGAPRVQSVQDAMKLPKGTRFIDPNGVERIR